MRHGILLALLFAGTAAHAAGPSAGVLSIEGIARDAPGDAIYLKVRGTGDSDGDGVPDAGVLRLVCTPGRTNASFFHYDVKSPRDSASGMASGRRAAKPVAPFKEWGPMTPQFRMAQVGYTPGPAADVDTGTPLALHDAPGLCAAAQAEAQAIINTSRSHLKGR